MQIHGNAIGRGAIDDTSHDQTIKQSSNVNKFASQDGLEAHQRSTSSPNTGNDKPTDGASDTNKSNPDPNADLPYVIEDRLKRDPAFLEAQAALAEVSTLENDFTLVDRHTGIGPDSRIEYANLVALSNDPGANPAARAAANRLLANTSLWNAIAKGDQWVGIHDVQGLIQDRKNAVNTAREAVANQARAERGVPTATTNSESAPATGPGESAPTTPGTGATTEADEKKKAAAEIMAEADKSLPKPAPSQFSGLEGASENINNLIGWGEQEIDRLTTLMGKTDDPAVLKQLENKINQMSRRMQQLTAMMQQIMTMMSNLSKMYSDIAMNSVRNMK